MSALSFDHVVPFTVATDETKEFSSDCTGNIILMQFIKNLKNFISLSLLKEYQIVDSHNVALPYVPFFGQSKISYFRVYIILKPDAVLL